MSVQALCFLCLRTGQNFTSSTLLCSHFAWENLALFVGLNYLLPSREHNLFPAKIWQLLKILSRFDWEPRWYFCFVETCSCKHMHHIKMWAFVCKYFSSDERVLRIQMFWLELNFVSFCCIRCLPIPSWHFTAFPFIQFLCSHFLGWSQNCFLCLVYFLELDVVPVLANE